MSNWLISCANQAFFCSSIQIGHLVSATLSTKLDNLFVIHPNGETTNIKTSSRLSFLQEQDTKLIYPGSIIFVPRDSNFASSMQIASIWAPILSSLALSITSLSVLNNN